MTSARRVALVHGGAQPQTPQLSSLRSSVRARRKDSDIMKIISKRQAEHHVDYSRVFEWSDMPGAGFGFPCDLDGNVDVAALPEAAQDSYRSCTDGTYDVIDQGVVTYHSTYHRPAVGRCDVCRGEVHLANFTNTCDCCGTDYNMSGHRLAPRAQWGEETGEHWTECY